VVEVLETVPDPRDPRGVRYPLTGFLAIMILDAADLDRRLGDYFAAIASGLVLGQLAVAAKTNEIPTVRKLLRAFTRRGLLVTIDAMHTQVSTAKLIGGQLKCITMPGPK
jgi:hypothetical protein